LDIEPPALSRQKQGAPGQEVETKRLNCHCCNLLRYRRKALRQGHPRGLLALPSDGSVSGVGLTPWTTLLELLGPRIPGYLADL